MEHIKVGHMNGTTWLEKVTSTETDIGCKHTKWYTTHKKKKNVWEAVNDFTCGSIVPCIAVMNDIPSHE